MGEAKDRLEALANLAGECCGTCRFGSEDPSVPTAYAAFLEPTECPYRAPRFMEAWFGGRWVAERKYR